MQPKENNYESKIISVSVQSYNTDILLFCSEWSENRQKLQHIKHNVFTYQKFTILIFSLKYYLFEPRYCMLLEKLIHFFKMRMQLTLPTVQTQKIKIGQTLTACQHHNVSS